MAIHSPDSRAAESAARRRFNTQKRQDGEAHEGSVHEDRKRRDARKQKTARRTKTGDEGVHGRGFGLEAGPHASGKGPTGPMERRRKRPGLRLGPGTKMKDASRRPSPSKI